MFAHALGLDVWLKHVDIRAVGASDQGIRLLDEAAHSRGPSPVDGTKFEVLMQGETSDLNVRSHKGLPGRWGSQHTLAARATSYGRSKALNAMRRQARAPGMPQRHGLRNPSSAWSSAHIPRMMPRRVLSVPTLLEICGGPTPLLDAIEALLESDILRRGNHLVHNIGEVSA